MRNPFDATGTIGSRPCELSLNKILADKNDPRLNKKIIRILQATKHRFKQLASITDDSTRSYFKELLKKEAENTISNITGFAVRGELVTDVVTSHACCCINSYFRNV